MSSLNPNTTESRVADTNAQPLLELRDVGIAFAGKELLQISEGVSLKLYPGEVFGLVGESGCGKSVTSMSIPALLPVPGGQVCEGDILWQGESLLKPKDQRKMLRAGRVGVIFQDPSSALNPVLTLGAQLREVFEWNKTSKGNKQEKITAMLREVGFADSERVLKSYPHELSGGMLQRVMIAMALLPEPDLIIADEPTTALDVTVQAQVMEMLTALTQKNKVAVLLITHNLNLVAQYASRLAVMYAGRIIEEGSVEQVLHVPGHPYTHGLLGALPGSRQSEAKGIRSIPGTVPHPRDFLTGCRFAPRCERATEECRQKPPFERKEHQASQSEPSQGAVAEPSHSMTLQSVIPHRYACFHPLEDEDADV